MQCVEYQLTEREALEWLIQTHRPLQGLNDFIRIELALDLEPHYQEKAVLNQQAGGRGKGLSKLTKAETVNSRREVARVAQVSVGNVRKVKYIPGACMFATEGGSEDTRNPDKPRGKMES